MYATFLWHAHARRLVSQLSEVAVPRALVQGVLKRIGQPPGICPADIQRWHNLKSASADLRVVQRLTEDVEHTLGLFEVAGKQALRIGADTLDAVCGVWGVL